MKHFLPLALLCLLLLNKTVAQSDMIGNCISTCHGTLGDNIYPNGDFGTGLPNVVSTDPGIAPGYIYQTSPPPNDGYYTIANSTSPWGWFAADKWINIGDNGPEPNGYMMVVNASYPPGLFFQQTVAVCENTLYEFSVDVINIFEPQFQQSIKPNLSIIIDQVALCETGDIPIDAQWHTVRFSFTTAPGQTNLVLGMRNNAPGGHGNDLAIDNISFRACGPELLSPDTLFFCSGNAVSLDVEVLNSPFSSAAYQWQTLLNGNWEDVPGADSIVLNILDPQDGAAYRLLVASASANLLLSHCRAASNVIYLKQLPALIVASSGTNPTCFGENNGLVQAQVLSGAAPYSFVWNTDSTGSSLSGLPSGIYLVTVTDALGCSGTDTIALLETPQLVSDLIALPVSCFDGVDGQAIATATGGTAPYLFSWENGVLGDTIFGLLAGSYGLTVTDTYGCSSTATAWISSPSALSATTVSTEVSCYGGTDAEAQVLATGATVPYTFIWSSGQTNAQIDGITAGTYTVTVTDAQGCSTIAALNIDTPALLVLSALDGISTCNGGNDAQTTALATGGAGSYAFLWSNGQTSALNTGLVAGIYTVTVTDINGCTATTNATILEPELLEVQALSTHVSCFGAHTGLAQVNALGGTYPYSFIWSNGETGAQIAGLFAGIYTVTCTDAQGCSQTEWVAINQPPPLLSYTIPGDVSCFAGADGAAAVQITGGQAPYEYLWDNGQNSSTLVGLSAGVYTVITTDALGCTTLDTAWVNQPALLTLSTDVGAVSCYDGTDGRLQAISNGGTSPYSFAWSNGGIGLIISDLSAGLYALTATDAQGCTVMASAEVTAPSAVQSVVNVQDATCFGSNDGLASLVVSGGTAPYQYLWQNGQTTAEVLGLSSGWYSVSITDAQQCQGIIAVWVGTPQPLVAAPYAVPASCPEVNDGQVSVTATGGIEPYHFVWSNGQSGTEIWALSEGIYTVTATDAQGCTAITASTVDSAPPITVNLGLDQTFFLGDELLLHAQTNLSSSEIEAYHWSGSGGSIQCPDCDQFRFIPLASGCQQVILTTVQGCQAWDEVCFTRHSRRKIYVPNVFHPNDDGDNDFFTIYSDASVKQILYLKVFSRWGEQIFQANNFPTNAESSGWDGTYLGQPMNPAVFAWVAEVEFLDGEIIFLKGDVTLVR